MALYCSSDGEIQRVIARLTAGLLILLTVGVGVSAQTDTDEETFDFTTAQVTDVLSASDLPNRSHPGHTRVSPDGLTVVYDGRDPRGICLYTLATQEASCVAFPEEDASGGRVDIDLHTMLQWSPDGRYIALTEDNLVSLSDSDIWIFDRDAMVFTNLTDDGFSGSFLLETERDVVLDMVPTWHPVTGDLYFIRSIMPADDTSGFQSPDLYRIPRNSDGDLDAAAVSRVTTIPVDEPLTFFDQSNLQSFDGAASFSPDGTRLALLSRPINDADTEILVVDLDQQETTSVVQWDVLMNPAFYPQWFLEGEASLQVSGIDWAADDRIVVDLFSFDFSVQLFNTFLAIDVTTGDVSSVLDHSAVPGQRELFTEPENYEFPRVAVLSPDGEGVIYFNNKFEQFISFSLVSVDGSEPQVIHEIDPEDFELAPMYFGSIGTTGDVVSVALYGYIVTFERGG